MSLNQKLYTDLLAALQAEDKPIKLVARAVHALMEDILPNFPSIRGATRVVHVALKKDGFSRSYKTLEGYWKTVSWLDEGAWVKGRSYSRHYRAMTLGWTRQRLIEEIPPTTGSQGDGLNGMTYLTRALDTTTRMEHTVAALEVEQRFARGTRKRLINKVMPDFKEALLLVSNATDTLVGKP